MFHLIFRSASGLLILLALGIVAACAVPDDESQLEAFMTAPENCTGPCLLGIRPGKTTVKDAMEILQTHAWAENVRLTASGNGYGQIRWQWSGKQPDLIDDSYAGRITFFWEQEEENGHPVTDSKIDTITIQTRIRMYILQVWYGMPNSGMAGFRLDHTLGYSVNYVYPGTTMTLYATMLCPVSLMTYWNARTLIRISIGLGTSPYVAPPDMVKLC